MYSVRRMLGESRKGKLTIRMHGSTQYQARHAAHRRQRGIGRVWMAWWPNDKSGVLHSPLPRLLTWRTKADGALEEATSSSSKS